MLLAAATFNAAFIAYKLFIDFAGLGPVLVSGMSTHIGAGLPVMDLTKLDKIDQSLPSLPCVTGDDNNIDKFARGSFGAAVVGAAVVGAAVVGAAVVGDDDDEDDEDDDLNIRYATIRPIATTAMIIKSRVFIL